MIGHENQDPVMNRLIESIAPKTASLHGQYSAEEANGVGVVVVMFGKSGIVVPRCFVCLFGFTLLSHD